MKKLFVLALSCLSADYAFSTDVSSNAKIVTGQSYVLYPHPNGGKPGNQVDEIAITVHLDPAYTAGKGNTIAFDDLIAFGMPGNVALLSKTAIVPDDAKPDKDTKVTLKIQTDNMPDTLTESITGYIKITGHSADEYFSLRLSPGSTYHPDKPFWVEVGANFDLVDDVKPDNVFTGVFFYKRDMRRAFTGKNHRTEAYNNIAFSAGIYESKASTFSNGPDNTPISYYDSSSFLGSQPNGTVKAVKYTNVGKVRNNIEVRNIGMFLSPQLRLSNGSANANGAHFFVSAHFEVISQQIHNNFDYSGTARVLADTVTLPASELSRSDTVLFPAKPEGKPINVFTHYEGIGFPLFIKTKDVNLYLNPVVGMSNQPKTPDLATLEGITSNTLDRQWRPFYLVQFRLSDETYGITLSGEVRGLLTEHSPPFMTLLLSKKFDLTKIMRFR